jgi:hypothetical protein
MWLITEDGFASVVAHRERPDHLLVRARARGDLENLCRIAAEEGVEGFDPVGVFSLEQADYRWRLEVRRDDFAALTAAMVGRIDYDNFKNRVGQKDPARASLYSDVWGTLFRIQETE